MSLQYIPKTYGVPAKRGKRVRFTPDSGQSSVGVIVGARQQYLRVKLDGIPWPRTLHPTWMVEYLP